MSEEELELQKFRAQMAILQEKDNAKKAALRKKRQAAKEKELEEQAIEEARERAIEEAEKKKRREEIMRAPLNFILLAFSKIRTFIDGTEQTKNLNWYQTDKRRQRRDKMAKYAIILTLSIALPMTVGIVWTVAIALMAIAIAAY